MHRCGIPAHRHANGGCGPCELHPLSVQSQFAITMCSLSHSVMDGEISHPSISIRLLPLLHSHFHSTKHKPKADTKPVFHPFFLALVVIAAAVRMLSLISLLLLCQVFAWHSASRLLFLTLVDIEHAIIAQIAEANAYKLSFVPPSRISLTGRIRRRQRLNSLEMTRMYSSVVRK